MSRTTLLAANVQNDQPAAVLMHSTQSAEKAPVGVPEEYLILKPAKRTRQGDLVPMRTGRRSPRLTAPEFDPSLVSATLSPR